MLALGTPGPLSLEPAAEAGIVLGRVVDDFVADRNEVVLILRMGAAGGHQVTGALLSLVSVSRVSIIT